MFPQNRGYLTTMAGGLFLGAVFSWIFREQWLSLYFFFYGPTPVGDFLQSIIKGC